MKMDQLANLAGVSPDSSKAIQKHGPIAIITSIRNATFIVGQCAHKVWVKDYHAFAFKTRNLKTVAHWKPLTL